MPKVPVNECPAGTAMDASIAEALGYEVEWSPQPDGLKVPIYLSGEVDFRPGHGQWIGWRPNWRIVPNYSLNIAVAWELLPEMQSAYGILLAIVGNVTECKIMKEDKPIIGRAEGEGTKRSALAISRVFLKANGIEYVEVPWKGTHYCIGEGIPLDHD